MAIKVKEVVVRFEENDDPALEALTTEDYQPLRLSLHHHKMAEPEKFQAAKPVEPSKP